MPACRYLAFDLGAESGRALVGTLADGRVHLEEIHRFPNEPVEVRGTLHWDVLALYGHVLEGARKYVERFGGTVAGVGVDTWGLDFGLLSADGQLLQNPVSYRDRRTEGMEGEVARRISPRELFERTGISFNRIHTICQLLSLRLSNSPALDCAATFLMMPDLLAYFLSGRARCERTNAISTQLYDPRRGMWSDDLLARLGLPRGIMPEIVNPATVLGPLGESARRSTGLDGGLVIAPCSHDTASAVSAVPARGPECAFISSGTWSVLGMFVDEVVTSTEAFSARALNELAVDGFFLCRNIMGLWLLQQARAAWRRNGESYSYADLGALAEAAPAGGGLVHPDDPAFLAPEDMLQAIRGYCVRTGQVPPETPGAIARCILESLALSYRHGLDQFGRILGRQARSLNIVGGGSRNRLLCRFAADATGLPVTAGPEEATSVGNVLVQALATGDLASPGEIVDVVRRSTELTVYEPCEPERWDDRYETYLRPLGDP